MDRTVRRFISVFFLSLALVGCGGGEGSGGTGAPFTNPLTEGPDTGFVDTTGPLGFYTNGSIEDAIVLPNEGQGFLKVFRLRNRAYASATLVRTLGLAAAAWRAEFPTGDRVQIGDITDWNGGFLSGHASHQNGLDVDVAYLKVNHIERDPNTSGPNGFQEQFVSSNKLTANFDVTRNWAIIRNLVMRGTVGRIFVDPAIKNAFCQRSGQVDPTLSAANRTEVLRRLRPLANHADHFHVRLKCPTGHPKCLAQTEPPAGNGCAEVASVSGQMFDVRTPEQRADDELGLDEG